MAWNEPGGGDKDPWGNRGDQGPPDLDEVFKNIKDKFNGLFGGRGSRQGGRGGTSGGSGGFSPRTLGIVAAIVVALWLSSGFYIIQPAEKGVITRLGAYIVSADPGLHWHAPWPIETVDIVNVDADDYLNQTTSMLTADENIVLVDMVVQFLRTNPLPFLFEVEDPVGTLADISESAIREVIGKGKLDYVLGEGREAVAAQTRDVIQGALDEYDAGIVVTQVTLQDVNFPGQVEAAVQDAIKAREDKERLKFEAQSYANDILPKARGAAVRQIQDAEAYKERVTADAQGEAARFTALLVEYKKGPRVTRERLCIDAMEDVYSNSSKVLLDAQGSGNLLYLPIDKLINQGGASQGGLATRESEIARAESQRQDNRSSSGRDDARARESR